ncbi:MAG: hypothetical protein KC493_08660 [Bacteriovoracaceae bacterium]|nr:hypothetical protein [Bacteriovoracaceae bacterium]
MKLLFFFLFIISPSIEAAYYSTLPKGVRNFTYRFIKTNTVSGSYNSAGSFEAYNINAQINADVIKGLNGTVDTYLNGLSQSDYDSFSFGTFEGAATSNVEVHAFGGGWGITDTFTIYGFIPFYKAVVDLNLARTEKGRKNVGSSILLEGLPDIDVRIVQNLFVNYYDYQPLGKWEATGFGDLELGTMWNFYKIKNFGAMMSFGVIAPTGKEDNEDILQDINFGDGQWDIFYEAGFGFRPYQLFSLDSWFRYTYQFKYEKNIRLPDSESFPITSRKGNASIKRGNKLLMNLQGNTHINDEWTTSLLYSWEYKTKDDFKSSFSDADYILEKETSFQSHSLRLNFNFSTVSLFKKKKFIAPIDLNIAAQTILGGENTPKYERYDFEVRMFF